jgi:chromosome segregation ATPase
VFWLGVLVTVGFTAWRLLANLKALARSLTDLSERLGPTLQELEAKSRETAELSERLQRRQAALQDAARQRQGGEGRRRSTR